MNWLLACFLWLCLLVPGQAQPVAPAAGAGAAAPITLRAGMEPLSLSERSVYWIDPTGRRTIDEIESLQPTLEWRTRKGAAQYDLDGKAMWLRFDADVAENGSRWFIEIALSGLDRAVLYYRDAQGRWVTQEAGNSVSVARWPLPGRFPTFELAGAASGRAPVTYWLRVERWRVAFAAPITLYSQHDLTDTRESAQILLGAYFGLALLILVLATVNAATWRDRNFAAYAIYVTTLALGQFAYLGIGAMYLWPNLLAWNAMAPFVLPSLSPAAALWMLRVVTGPARFSRRLDRLMIGLVALQCLVCVLDGLLALPITFLLLKAFTLITLLGAAALLLIVMSRGDDPDIGLIALGLLPVAIAALFPIARSFELIPTSALTRYSLAMAAALEMPILFYALNRRASRRRESNLRKAALSRIDPLTGLENAQVLEQRLGEAAIRARRYRHNFGLFVVELANHASISRVHGEAIMERALVVAGTHLKAVARDTDVTARLEGPRFALLLQGPASARMLADTATAIVARGLRESRSLPPGMMLRFHVAVAKLPDGELGSPVLLARLLSEVYSISLDARKTIRQVNF